MKKYAATLEYEGTFPAKPSDAIVLAAKKASVNAIGGALAKSGWRVEGVRIEATETTNKYKLIIPLVRRSAREFQEAMAQQQLNTIASNLSSRIPGWKRVGDDLDLSQDDNEELSLDELLEFPDDWQQYFSHIYERDIQINEMMTAIKVARESNMRVRNHVLLHGEPGGGKTEILLSLTNIFSSFAIKHLDATSTTKAGAIDFLLKSDMVPPIIAIEEIEKVVNENDLPWLLSILDKRGKIIKTNARVGSIEREVRPLVIATVNNMEKLRSFHEGALFDRFNVPLYCPIPSEDLIRKILRDQLDELPNGNEAWIDPAIRYAFDVEHTYQIRRIKAIMTIGGDRLLDGSYQRNHQHLLDQRQKDDEKLTEFVR